MKKELTERQKVNRIQGLRPSQENFVLIEILLQKFCHAAACETWWQCPHGCCRSRIDPMLDLDTSIAWSAQGELRLFRESCQNQHETLSILGVLETIVDRHNAKHRYLSILVSEAYNQVIWADDMTSVHYSTYVKIRENLKDQDWYGLAL